jgi:hypothetical protein
MAGRFLYGDSEPFPGGFVLTTLRSFVTSSAKVLALQHEADELERSLGARAQEHTQALESITSFFQQVSDLIAERAVRSPAPQVIGPYAAQLMEFTEELEREARDQAEVVQSRAARSPLGWLHDLAPAHPCILDMNDRC